MHKQGKYTIKVDVTSGRSQSKWSILRNVTDWLWKVLTGYGVHIWPLVLIAFTVILVGLLFFPPQRSLDQSGRLCKFVPLGGRMAPPTLVQRGSLSFR